MVNVKKLIQAKKRGQKWAMLTAYDALTSSLLESEGVDWILVGDSVGMVLLGYASTTDVTMDEMIHHASAVRRGAPKSFIIGDMPLAALSKGPAHALACAKRFIREAGCDAVKVEWRKDAIAITKKLLQNKIPVMGHVGLTPQSVKKGESFRVRGKAAGEAAAVYESALAFEKAGTFSVLVECVPEPVGQAIARALKTPVIGIGAGRYCDGQVRVSRSRGYFHEIPSALREALLRRRCRAARRRPEIRAGSPFGRISPRKTRFRHGAVGTKNIPGKNMKIKALGMLSGGLDSTLAAKVLVDLGLEVEGINFSTGFCVTEHTSELQSLA
jgi:3-methyl-2-oxobutanoate hydroxymethyltransferase